MNKGLVLIITQWWNWIFRLYLAHLM